MRAERSSLSCSICRLNSSTLALAIARSRSVSASRWSASPNSVDNRASSTSVGVVGLTRSVIWLWTSFGLAKPRLALALLVVWGGTGSEVLWFAWWTGGCWSSGTGGPAMGGSGISISAGSTEALASGHCSRSAIVANTSVRSIHLPCLEMASGSSPESSFSTKVSRGIPRAWAAWSTPNTNALLTTHDRNTGNLNIQDV